MKNRQIINNMNLYDKLIGVQEQLEADSDDWVCILLYLSRFLKLKPPEECSHDCKECMQQWLNTER